MGKEKNKLVDICDGDSVYAWSDDKFVFLTIKYNAVTVALTKKEFKKFKEEIRKLQ